MQNVSLSGWAGLWGLFNGQTLSKQAVAKRFSPAAVAFLKETLNTVVSALCLQPLKHPSFLRSFPRVLLQDSTCVALPQKLATEFPGSFSHRHGRAATLKIQAVYDLTAQSCASFLVGSFSQNDQGASPSILTIARRGDLIIRDLGYAVLGVFQQLHDQGIFFLSRWLTSATVLDPQTGKKFNLLLKLRAFGQWDGPVLLGQESKVPVRLVALPVPEPVAAERRRKLKANRDRRCRPSSQRLALCGWDIFITNVPLTVWPPTAVPKVYELRWRIEILFKAWKSHFQLEALTPGSAGAGPGAYLWPSIMGLSLSVELRRNPGLSLHFEPFKTRLLEPKLPAPLLVSSPRTRRTIKPLAADYLSLPL